MVRDFHIAKTEAEISKYVGYIASCFSFCQFLSSIQWGVVADKIGRKPVLMIGLIGSTVGMLLFGFSKNYWTALLARCLMGFLNGNTGVLRTVIGENCKEKKHQALLLSSMPFLYQIGSIIGPVIGGLLTNASDNIPVSSANFDKFIANYPYALSNLVISLAFTFSIACCFLFLEETHHKYQYKRDYGLDLGDKIRALFGFKPPVRPWHRVMLNGEESESSSFHHDSIENSEDESEHTNKVVVTTDRWNALLSSTVLKVVTIQVLMSAHNTVYNEFFPVYLAKRTIREGDSTDLTSPLISKFPFKIIGGMGYDSVTVGKILSVTGMCGIFVVAVIFPYIDRTYPPVKAFRWCAFLYTFIYLFLPFLVFTLPPNMSPLMNKICLYCLTFTRVILSGTTVPLIVLLVHRASPPEHRAFINGATLSASALSRFISPLAWGYIMSYADQAEKGWITWWSLLVFSLLAFFNTFRLKDEDEEDDDFFDLNVAEQEEEELEG